MVAAVTLAGCGKKSSSSSSVTTTGSTSGNYQGVIENGRYKTSKARGVNTAQNANVYNLKAFESGLTNVSKLVFSTKSYIFQEGQYLSSSTLDNWLGRKTSSNPTGLNPAKGKSSDPNPEYIQQIEEQDYMQQSGNSLKLKGIVIGIGVNSEYTYQKTTDGPDYTKNISDAEVQKQGKLAAAKILKRLRARKDLKNVPIVIALFKQASDDSLVGGPSLPTARITAPRSHLGRPWTTRRSSYQRRAIRPLVIPVISPITLTSRTSRPRFNPSSRT